ncbi:MAG TPA: amidohydrolase family protein, partial [Puia sp.]
ATSEDAEVQTRFLSELALTHPEIRGVVGWIDLYNDRAVEKIQEFQQYNSVKGYRIDAGRISSILPPAMDLLLTGQYSLDLTLGGENDIAPLSRWLSAHPDQSFILRDAGHADPKLLPSKTWETNIRELAKNQNLACKLSGLFIQGHWKTWKPTDFYPFLDILFNSFGTDRLLFASDWPFLLLAGIYVQWKSLVEKFMEKYLPEDREKIFGENARRLYRI